MELQTLVHIRVEKDGKNSFMKGLIRLMWLIPRKGFKAQFWLPRGKQGSLLRLRVYPKTSLHFCTPNNRVDFKCIPGKVLMNTSYGRHAQQENSSTWRWVFKRSQVLGTMLRSWCSYKMTQSKWIQFKTKSWKLDFHRLF